MPTVFNCTTSTVTWIDPFYDVRFILLVNNISLYILGSPIYVVIQAGHNNIFKQYHVLLVSFMTV